MKDKKLVYDKNRNPKYIPTSPVVHDEKWRKETSEHFQIKMKEVMQEKSSY